MPFPDESGPFEPDPLHLTHPETLPAPNPHPGRGGRHWAADGVRNRGAGAAANGVADRAAAVRGAPAPVRDGRAQALRPPAARARAPRAAARANPNPDQIRRPPAESPRNRFPGWARPRRFQSPPRPRRYPNPNAGCGKNRPAPRRARPPPARDRDNRPLAAAGGHRAHGTAPAVRHRGPGPGHGPGRHGGVHVPGLENHPRAGVPARARVPVRAADLHGADLRAVDLRAAGLPGAGLRVPRLPRDDPAPACSPTARARGADPNRPPRPRQIPPRRPRFRAMERRPAALAAASG
jgi:hypothetical protein